jgi:hypothetical protein
MSFCISFLGLFWSLSYKKNVFSLSSKLLQWSPIPAGVVGSAQNPPANASVKQQSLFYNIAIMYV